MKSNKFLSVYALTLANMFNLEQTKKIYKHCSFCNKALYSETECLGNSCLNQECINKKRQQNET